MTPSPRKTKPSPRKTKPSPRKVKPTEKTPGTAESPQPFSGKRKSNDPEHSPQPSPKRSKPDHAARSRRIQQVVAFAPGLNHEEVREQIGVFYADTRFFVESSPPSAIEVQDVDAEKILPIDCSDLARETKPSVTNKWEGLPVLPPVRMICSGITHSRISIKKMTPSPSRESSQMIPPSPTPQPSTEHPPVRHVDLSDQQAYRQLRERLERVAEEAPRQRYIEDDQRPSTSFAGGQSWRVPAPSEASSESMETEPQASVAAAYAGLLKKFKKVRFPLREFFRQKVDESLADTGAGEASQLRLFSSSDASKGTWMFVEKGKQHYWYFASDEAIPDEEDSEAEEPSAKEPKQTKKSPKKEDSKKKEDPDDGFYAYLKSSESSDTTRQTGSTSLESGVDQPNPHLVADVMKVRRELIPRRGSPEPQRDSKNLRELLPKSPGKLVPRGPHRSEKTPCEIDQHARDLLPQEKKAKAESSKALPQRGDFGSPWASMRDESDDEQPLDQ